MGFSGGSTGSIRLLCPFTVTANMLDVNIGLIFMSIIDGDGMNTGARVRVFFRHAGIGTNVAVTDAPAIRTRPIRLGQHGLLLSRRADQDKRILLV